MSETPFQPRPYFVSADAPESPAPIAGKADEMPEEVRLALDDAREALGRPNHCALDYEVALAWLADALATQKVENGQMQLVIEQQDRNYFRLVPEIESVKAERNTLARILAAVETQERDRAVLVANGISTVCYANAMEHAKQEDA